MEGTADQESRMRTQVVKEEARLFKGECNL